MASQQNQAGAPRTDLQVTAPIPRWKRALDIICCIAALPALAICTLLAAILTTIASPGPILFRQDRIGYKGRRFKLYKFRTMHGSAATTSHQTHFSQLMCSNVPMQKLDSRGDSRIIPGGWILRASGFDELPQIINVLRGDMSIVGPRPSIPYEYEQYSDWQRERTNTQPGLTGLWQVSGKNRTTFDEMIRLDITYVQQKSLLMDVKIIAMTVPALCIQVADTRKLRSGSPKPSVNLPAPAPANLRADLVGRRTADRAV